MGTTEEAATDALDDRLTGAARTGDRASFDALVRSHMPMAWRTGCAVSGSALAAEQAIAEAATAALDSQGLPYRLAVVKETLTTIDGEADGGVAPPPDPVPNATVAAFRVLPPAGRTAVWLSLMEGSSLPETAAVLGARPAATAELRKRSVHQLRSGLRGAGLASDREAVKVELGASVPVIPATVTATAAAWWMTQRGPDTAEPRASGSWPRRSVGAGAAAVFGVALMTAFALGGGDGSTSAASSSASGAGGEQAAGRSLVPALPLDGGAAQVPAAAVAMSAVGRRPAAPAAPTATTARRPSAAPTPPPAAPRPILTPPPAPPPTAPAPAPAPAAEPKPVPAVEVAADVAGTPVTASVSPAGVSAQVGDLVIGTPPPAPEDAVVVVTVDLGNDIPPIVIPIGL